MKCDLLGNVGLRVAENISARLVLTTIALAIAAFLSGCATAPKPADPGKLYHVGLVWLKEPGNAEHRQKIIEAAHSFAREIPEVQFLSVGRTLPGVSSWHDASFDVCFVMRLEDRAATDRYAKNQVHEKAAREVFLPVSQKILFYDFTSE
jgi:Stress responsive A/B Barrel Domain